MLAQTPIFYGPTEGEHIYRQGARNSFPAKLTRSKAEGMPRMDGLTLPVCGLKEPELELQSTELLQHTLFHDKANLLRIRWIL